MKTKTIRQTVNFAISPEKLYSLLFDNKVLTKLHGGKTAMTRRPKGKFSVFGGYCHGYNLRLEENKLIEQAWHFQEDGWPDDHYSICTFLLEPSARGTRLIFTHKGVPEHKVQDLKEGWYTYYWRPLLGYIQGGTLSL
jgi:activator of HSP90 ATPase